MAGLVVTRADRPRDVPLVGVVPCADHSGAIGGAPPPLLQTGDGTFLERAIGLLRLAGVDEVLVGVRDERDPVAAHARRAGATVVQVAEGARDPKASLHAAAEVVRSRDAEVPSPVPSFLCLPPVFPLIRDATMEELVRAWRAGVSTPEVLAPALPPDSPRAAVPWSELAPLFLRGPDPAAHLESLPVRVEVADPGVAERIDTLPLYRRHFPQAFRKRFQKW